MHHMERIAPKKHDGPRFSKTQREYLQLRAVQLEGRGLTHREIAEALKMHQSTVTRMIGKAREAWRNASAFDIGAETGRKLEELRALKRELYDQWDASKSEKQISEMERSEAAGGKGEPSEVRKTKLKKELREANPRYAREIRAIIHQECELMGLYPPKRKEISGLGGGPVVVVTADSMAKARAAAQEFERSLPAAAADNERETL